MRFNFEMQEEKQLEFSKAYNTNLGFKVRGLAENALHSKIFLHPVDQADHPLTQEWRHEEEDSTL